MSASVATLADVPAFVADQYPRPAFLRRCLSSTYQDVSTTDFVERIRLVSLALQSAGIRPGDRVAIVAESCPEWGIVDLAILTAGAVSVPIYPTLSQAQARYILTDAEARLAFVSDAVQFSKIRPLVGQVPALERVVALWPDGIADIHTSRGGTADRPLPVASSLQHLCAHGAARLAVEDGAAAAYQARIAAIRPDDLATIIYTSGTTGEPKGVMLTHDNLLANIRATRDLLDTSSADVSLSFLPLSHIFERMVFYKLMLDGVFVVFAESLQTVARDLERVKPTVMTGVPRVYEKFHAGVLDAVARGSSRKRSLFGWAIGVGRRHGLARLAGRWPGLWLGIQHAAADRLVLRKIRARTGEKLRITVSGSAPRSEERV
jgi:long-chain acyl-CoA synthetase